MARSRSAFLSAAILAVGFSGAGALRRTSHRHTVQEQQSGTYIAYLNLADIGVDVNVRTDDKVTLFEGSRGQVKLPDELTWGMIHSAKQLILAGKISLAVGKIMLMFAKPFAEDMVKDWLADLKEDIVAQFGSLAEQTESSNNAWGSKKNTLDVNVSTKDKVIVNVQTNVATGKSKVDHRTGSSSLMAKHFAKTFELAFQKANEGAPFSLAQLAALSRGQEVMNLQVNVSTFDKITVNVGTTVATDRAQINQRSSLADLGEESQTQGSESKAADELDTSRTTPKIKIQVNVHTSDTVTVKTGVNAVKGNTAISCLESMVSSIATVTENLAEQVAQSVSSAIASSAAASLAQTEGQQVSVSKGTGGWDAHVHVSSRDVVTVNVDTNVANGASNVVSMDIGASSAVQTSQGESSRAGEGLTEGVTVKESAPWGREVEVNTLDDVVVNLNTNVATDRSSIDPVRKVLTGNNRAMAEMGKQESAGATEQAWAAKVSTTDDIDVDLGTDYASGGSNVAGNGASSFNVNRLNHRHDRDIDISVFSGIFNGLDRTVKMLFDVGTSDDVLVNVDTNVATRGSRITMGSPRAAAASLVSEELAAHVARSREAGAAARSAAGFWWRENYEIEIKVSSEDNVTVNVDTNVATDGSQIVDNHRQKWRSSLVEQQATREKEQPRVKTYVAPEALTQSQRGELGYDVHVKVRTHDDVTVNVHTNVATSSSTIKE